MGVARARCVGRLKMRIDQSDGRILVTGVTRGTPAYAAGLNVDDEILALDDYRVRDWGSRLEKYRAGAEAELLIARREKLIRLPVTFAAEPPNRWHLERRLVTTGAQRTHRESWLEGR